MSSTGTSTGFATINRRMGGKEMNEQNFANHVRFVSPFHFFAVSVFVINFFWSLYRLWRLGFSFAGIFGVFLASALVVLAFESGLCALAVRGRLRALARGRRYARRLPPRRPP